MRDYNYIRQMKTLNDSLWRDKERWLYYNRQNQNFIVPIAVICFLCFFVKGGPMLDVIIVAYTLWVCHENNKKLDRSVNIQIKRLRIREYRRKAYNMDV